MEDYRKNAIKANEFWTNEFVTFRDARDIQNETLTQSSEAQEVMNMMRCGFEFFRDVKECGYKREDGEKIIKELSQNIVNINDNHLAYITGCQHMYEEYKAHFELILRTTKEVLLSIVRIHEVEFVLPPSWKTMVPQK